MTDPDWKAELRREQVRAELRGLSTGPKIGAGLSLDGFRRRKRPGKLVKLGFAGHRSCLRAWPVAHVAERHRRAGQNTQTRFRPEFFAEYRAWSATLISSKIVSMPGVVCASPMLTVALMACKAIDKS
jgi:hypothetical protein